MRPSFLVFAILPACSHTYFQFTPNATETADLVRAEEALLAAGAAKDEAAIAPRMDPDGRKATFLAAHDLIGQKTDAGKALDGLAVATILVAALDGTFGAGGEVGSDFVERATPWFRDQVEKGVASKVFGKVNLRGLVPAMGEEFFPSADSRRARLATRFAAELPEGCVAAGIIVSYRASILDHVEWDWAAQSRTFAAWRKEVRAIHLAKLACGEKTGLWMLDTYDREIRLVGWHYFSPKEWAAVEPRLKKSLELPAR